MANFGDYETVGEPLAVLNLQGYSSAVWKVRKAGAADNREFVVKTYSPHRKAMEGGVEDALDRDRGLEFLEGVKQLKKAHDEDPRCLVPVHDLGITPDGVWYASDFYQRGSLMALIGRRAKVDGAALKQIVSCIVAACLALQKSRGASHGNLKASNVFLAGKPRPLPKTQIVLADPVPAAPLQLARLESEDRKTVDELLHQTAEVQDLRALGEIILQLVERRIIRSGYCDPPQRSEMWDSLGKDGERWRQICVQLLDPQLSLAEINLASLAKKFPARAPASGKAMLVAAAVVAVCLIGWGGVYGLARWNTHRHEQNCRDFTNAAKQAYQNNDLLDARRYISEALKWEREDKAALGLRSEIESKIQKEYDSSLAVADQEFQNKYWAAALNDVNKALNWKPDGTEALNLKNRIAEEQNKEKARQTQQQQYDDAVAAIKNALHRAQADYDAQQYDPALNEIAGALNECGTARTLGAANPVVDLEKDLRSLQATVQTAKTQGETKATQYAATVAGVKQAMAQAQTDYEAGPSDPARYDSALTKITGALDECRKARTLGATATVDQLATDLTLLQKKVQTAKMQSETRAGQYADAIKAVNSALQQAQADYDARQYDPALNEITNGLAECATARTLGAAAPVEELEKKLKLLQESVKTDKAKGAAMADQYAEAMAVANKAMTQAQADYDARQYDPALKEIAVALEKCRTARTLGAAAPVDQLKGDLQKLQSAVQTAASSYLDMTNRLSKAYLLLTTAGRYQEAQPEFERAAALAKDLKDATTQKAAEAGQQCATELAQAGAATSLDDQITWLEKASQHNIRVAGLEDKLTAAQNAKKSYQTAMNAAQNAFDRSDFSTAMAKAGDALKIEPYDSQAKNLDQLAADALAAKNDFAAADYLGAGKLCQKHPEVVFFNTLAETNRSESNLLAQATAKFGQGDYSFTEDWSKTGYPQKSSFTNLLASAKSEAGIFNQLTGLIGNPANWAKVRNILADPSYGPFINKNGFNKFRAWSEQNDPVGRLNQQLGLFEVWFGVQGQSPAVIDPYTRKPAAKLPSGVVLDPYYQALTQLEQNYKSLEGPKSSHLPRITAVRKAMDNW